MEVNTKINPKIDDSWLQVLSEEFQKEYFINIKQAIQKDKSEAITIYPKGIDIFKAFNITPFNKVKVIILGQDPYHGANQAHGLSFSVPEHIPLPPSLINIFKELENDLSVHAPKNGNLIRWAEQGVFLLNAFLTVRAGEPTSHQNIGWQFFTDAVIKLLSQNKTHLVFILWGSFAISKKQLIDETKHLVITSPHPSPLSAYRGFMGSKPFSKTNEYLIKHNIDPIIWNF